MLPTWSGRIEISIVRESGSGHDRYSFKRAANSCRLTRLGEISCGHGQFCCSANRLSVGSEIGRSNTSVSTTRKARTSPRVALAERGLEQTGADDLDRLAVGVRWVPLPA